MTADDTVAIREEVIESMERSAEVYGLSRSAGRIYGVLYFAEEPLSIPELVDRTGYAKSTISNVTRKLTRIGLIRRRSSSGGGRRVQFEPEPDLWFVIQDVFQQYVHREMNGTQRTFDQALDRLEQHGSDTEATREKIRELQSTYAELQTLVELAMEQSPSDLIEAIEQYEE